MDNDKNSFLELTKESMEANGFWKEEFRYSVIKFIESWYKKEVTDHWKITDLIINGDTVLIKWEKRTGSPDALKK